MTASSTRPVALPNLHTYAGLMQLGKPERQRLIESLVSRKRSAPSSSCSTRSPTPGACVTQATVSRDIRELGLEKTQDPLGPAALRARRTSPAAPIPTRGAELDPRSVRPQGDAGREHRRRCSPSSARRRRSRARSTSSSTGAIVGTLAGDDTVLVVAPSERDARTLRARARRRARASPTGRPVSSLSCLIASSVEQQVHAALDDRADIVGRDVSGVPENIRSRSGAR